jgi:hypothetical protein
MQLIVASYRLSRSQRSLQNRWAEINKEVKLFSGILAKIERDNESGKTEEDMIAKAKEEYAQRFGVILRNGNFRPKPFAFSHVWPILKKHPKWATKPPDTPTSVQSREERLSGSGRKALKRAREEAKDPIGSAMVTEMKRKNNALEDMNTMEVLRDPTTPAEERAEGMSLMRQKMMARLRAEVAEQAATDRTARVRRRIAPPAAGGEEVAATDGGDEGGGGGEQEE